MCMYNLALNDELVRRTRQSFANEADMKAWLQRQVEALMIEYNTSQHKKQYPTKIFIIVFMQIICTKIKFNNLT